MKKIKNDTRSQLFLIIAVCGISVLMMLPVLLYPHYGLFSDAGQLIEFPKNFIESFPRSFNSLKPLEDGRWNPLFHLLTVFVYLISPNNALAFYCLQTVILCGALVSIVFILMRDRNVFSITIVSAILFVFSASFFESFYTLDKVEPRILLCMSVLLSSLFVNFGKSYPLSVSFYIIQVLFGVVMIFSKETAVFYGASVFLFGILLYFIRFEKRIVGLLLLTGLIQLAIFIIYVIAFKLLSYDMSYRYVSYALTGKLVLANIKYYITSSPEIIIALVIAVKNLVELVRSRNKFEINTIFVTSLLGLLLVVYFSGICLWRWPLDYYLLPAHFLSSIIIGIFAVKCFKNTNLVLRFCVLISFAIFVSFRIINGWAIYSQDALKDELSIRLANKVYDKASVIVDMYHPDGAEFGERIEFFTNVVNNGSIILYNFLDPIGHIRENVNRFQNSAGIAPTPEQLKALRLDTKNYVKWRFGDDINPASKDSSHLYNFDSDALLWISGMHWMPQFVKKGDILIAPFGSPTLSKINARGVNKYSQSQEDVERKIPYKIELLETVEKSLFGIKIGWFIFRVLESQPEYYKLVLMDLIKDVSVSDINANSCADPHNQSDVCLYMGSGFYNLEGTIDSFRWVGKSSNLYFSSNKYSKCDLEMDVEPLLDKNNTSQILSVVYNGVISNFSITARQKIFVTINGLSSKLSSALVQISGGLADYPPNETRELKARFFKFKLVNCK